MKETLLNLIAAMFLNTGVDISHMVPAYQNVVQVEFSKLKRNPYIRPVYSPKVLDLVFMKDTVGVMATEHLVYFMDEDNDIQCDIVDNLDIKMFGRVSNTPNTTDLVMYHFKAFENYKSVKSIIDEVACMYYIPTEMLTSMLYVESRFNRKAKSHTGVRGIAMITSRTAKRFHIDTTTTRGQIEGMAIILSDIIDKLPSEYYTLDERYKLASFCYNRGMKYYYKAVRTIRNKNLQVTYKTTIRELSKYKFCKEGITYLTRLSKGKNMFT